MRSQRLESDKAVVPAPSAMAFCPQCGAPTTPAMSFCVACGRTLEPPLAGPPSAQPLPAGGAAGGAPGRPLGKTVTPWLVILLAVVTLGIYPLFLWWRVSREVDTFAAARSRPLVVPGVIVSAVATAAGIILGAIAMSAIVSAVLQDPENVPEADVFTAKLAASPFYVITIVLALVGAILLYLGLGRVWTAMRAEEERLALPERTPAEAFLVVGLGAAASSAGSSLLAEYGPAGVLADVSGILGFVSFALGVALLWVMYSTQKRLNALWRTARGW